MTGTDNDKQAYIERVRQEAGSLIARYPWFWLPRLVQHAGSPVSDPYVKFYLSAHPYPRHLLQEITGSDMPSGVALPACDTGKDTWTEQSGQNAQAEHETQSQQGKQCANDLTNSIIDDFLKVGEYRIVPDEGTADFDAAEKSSVIEVTDDIASEQLARIYMAQGLTDKAEEIYRRLGKSVENDRTLE